MRRVLLFAAVAMLLAGVSSFAMAAEGDEGGKDKAQTKEGKVKSVDVEKKNIVVTAARDLTFTVTDDTKIVQGEKALALKDVKVGSEVNVEYTRKSKEERVATKITVTKEPEAK